MGRYDDPELSFNVDGVTEMTVQISLIRKLGGSIRSLDGSMTSIVEHPVEHTYETEKAAREDYELLVKLFKRISSIPEVD